ncbi:apical endosomal glycoprotein-like [Pecten maximus]|uniref:apical endosomal glycoprotein-like n=1 Tax=Pecten maximus TaxID=6579 RepID=UPI001458CF86|nr:apical endosomal glycoprotein-like [Pecten maximus]
MANLYSRWIFFYFIYLVSIMSAFHHTEARSVPTRSADVEVLSNNSCSDVGVTLMNQSCDFNHGYCSFSYPSYPHIQWKRYTGPRTIGVDSLHDGGPFLYPYMLGKRTGASSSINTTMISGGAVCIQFWYGMAYSGANLEVLLDTNGGETSLWKLAGNHGTKWKKAILAVYSQTPFKVTLSYIRKCICIR